MSAQPDAPPTLKREIALVLGLAERAGHHRALDWIERRWAQEHPSREWVLGTCVWCEIEFNCRREATEIDLGGGANVCDLHSWLLPAPPDAQVQLLRDVAAGREIAYDEETQEELEVLTTVGLLSGRRLKWAGRRALEYLDREAAGNKRLELG